MAYLLLRKIRAHNENMTGLISIMPDRIQIWISFTTHDISR